MLKRICFFIVVLNLFFLISCSEITQRDTFSNDPPFPEFNYEEYTFSFYAIRNIDNESEMMDIEYFFEGFDAIEDNLTAIFSDISNEDFYVYTEPLTGNYNDAWIVFSGPNESILVINIYCQDEGILMGLIVNDLSVEYFFDGTFDKELQYILNAYE